MHDTYCEEAQVEDAGIVLIRRKRHFRVETEILKV